MLRIVGQSLLKSHLDLEDWQLPGGMNATKNCTDCNEELATSQSEFNMLLISPIYRFDRIHGLDCGEMVGRSLLISHFDPEAWSLSELVLELELVLSR